MRSVSHIKWFFSQDRFGAACTPKWQEKQQKVIFFTTIEFLMLLILPERNEFLLEISWHLFNLVSVWQFFHGIIIFILGLGVFFHEKCLPFTSRLFALSIILSLSLVCDWCCISSCLFIQFFMKIRFEHFFHFFPIQVLIHSKEGCLKGKDWKGPTLYIKRNGKKSWEYAQDFFLRNSQI